MTIANELGGLFSAFLPEGAQIKIRFWDGSSVGNQDAKSTAVIHNPEALGHVIWSPGELGLARAYVSGAIDIEGDLYVGLRDLAGIEPNWNRLSAQTVIRTLKLAGKLGVLTRKPGVPVEETVPRGRVHSKFRDQKAISHHYDVSNDFYKLFLGSTMTYSCARFVTPEDDLNTAQVQKYDLICRKLDLKPGMRLLDVGCGWGGLLMHATKNYGVKAVGITISEEQAILARERVAVAGLSDSIEIRIQDYRDLGNDRFDAISSVGMFEHVGKKQMAEYFADLYAVLNTGGRLLNHAISKPHGSKMDPGGFIARYVFPDGELQDVATSGEAMEDAGFEMRDVESLREHYAQTLRFWVANLEGNWDAAVALVGESRNRVWRMYMAGSAVAFETNRISIHQTLGVKTEDNGNAHMPLTRRNYV